MGYVIVSTVNGLIEEITMDTQYLKSQAILLRRQQKRESERNKSNSVKTVYGHWYEGSNVVVKIDGERYERKVRYNKRDGLYIVIKNTKYFEYEADQEVKP